MKDVLGIIGGLGPKASAYFYDMITDMTVANKDQEHLNIILLSHSTIPDRTEYILDNSKDNPYPYLLEDVKTLERLGAKMIAIPCNTSCYFHKELQANTNVIVNNMVEDTILELKKHNIEQVAIMATSGTIASELYQKACIKYNIKYELPSKEVQQEIMSIIYDKVKKGEKVELENWQNVINSFKSKHIILGCTELSYLKRELCLNSDFIDPLEIQAKKVLNFFGKKINKDNNSL